MIIEIESWVRNKAIRYINIVNNNPKYDIWDSPTELIKGLSKLTIERIELEVVMLDIERGLGMEERRKHERKLKRKKFKSKEPPAEVIKLRVG